MKRKVEIFILILTIFILGITKNSDSITIDFDDKTADPTIIITNDYSALGVIFSNPDAGTGAIVVHEGNWGNWAVSHPNAVCITAKPPQFYKGRSYPKLGPKLWFLKKYKKDGDEDFYIKQYHKEVLNKLNPKKVYKELGEDVVLLCWEGSGKFCHRHIVAKWLSTNLGIEITELWSK